MEILLTAAPNAESGGTIKLRSGMYKPGRQICDLCGEEHGERFDCQAEGVPSPRVLGSGVPPDVLAKLIQMIEEARQTSRKYRKNCYVHAAECWHARMNGLEELQQYIIDRAAELPRNS